MAALALSAAIVLDHPQAEKENAPMQGDEIKRIRLELGLTQSELCDVLGISDRRTVRRWEKNERPITGPSRVLLRILERDGLAAIEGLES